MMIAKLNLENNTLHHNLEPFTRTECNIPFAIVPNLNIVS